MEDETKKNSINIEIDEANTTQAPSDPFEGLEMKFPCEFPISVMGKNEPDYKEQIFAILKKHVPELEQSSLNYAYSGGNKYCSVKAKFTAQSREQMDELYKELTAHKLVKWVL